uniref:G-patch domain-containing protein n=1 Tax=Peronospora matthiolae TaxID=2874970 RepID=A0AAV1TGV3_9STRA
MKRGNVRSQEVTDAQGRRRFHGAFTGGFSAGYYNSVGSQEGWTPQTFSSSRGSRPSRVEQRPEDFMDEEDDPLLGKRLETSELYDTLQTDAKRRLQQQCQPHGSSAAVIPGFTLPEDWALPVNESIGAKLLKQMGWKEGHGIGQHVRRRKFKKKEAKLLQQDEGEEEVYMPPRKVFDVQKTFPKPKLDRFGAGFDPYTDAPEFSLCKREQKERQKATELSHHQGVSFVDALKITNGSNRATSAYGLSALEENDDVDVYGTVSMAEFDRVIASTRTKSDVKRLGSSTLGSHGLEKTRHSRALCSDGRPVLPGFDLAGSREKPSKEVIPRLAVPSGFKAHHRFGEAEGEDDAVTRMYHKHNFATAKTVAGSVVTAKQRSALFDDDRQNTRFDTGKVGADAAEVVKPIGSVFDLLGEDQKAKLFSAAERAKQGSVSSHRTPAAVVKASTTLNDREPLVRGSAGCQFRAKISASIAKRFVASTSTAGAGKSDCVQNEEPQAKVLRRSQSSWIPKSLLCKRFHVKCVGPTGSSGKDDENGKKRDLFDEELVPRLMEYAADRAACNQSEAGGNEIVPAGEPQGLEAQDLPPLPAVKHISAGLLKSIFEPSDESEVSEESSDEGSDDDKDENRTSKVDESKQELPSTWSLETHRKSWTGGTEDLPCNSAGAHSSSSGDGTGTAIGVAAIRGVNEHAKRSVKRSRSIDAGNGSDIERRTKDEKHKHAKRKKRHKQRSSHDEKSKKKDRTERKSHKHRSSKRSRRSRSRDRSARRK